MSLFGVGRGRGPVPTAQNAQNREIEKTTNISSVIRSARWGSGTAGLSDKVSVTVQLNRQSMNKRAIIEIFYNTPDGNEHPFDVPFGIPVNGLEAVGTWQTKAPKMKDWTRGHFTFRVKIDGQMLKSDKLKLSDDPVSKVMRRIGTDGFDR